MFRNTKPSALAFAVLSTCVLAAPSALAVTVDNGNAADPLPIQVANVAFAGAASPGVALDPLHINISGTDQIIGRTTGFAIRIDLPANVTFASLPAPSIGAALPCGGVACWTAMLVAGGGATDHYAVFSVQPGADSLGVTAGTVLSFATGSTTGGTYPNITFAGLALTGQGVGNLVNIGTSVAVTVTFADPVTARQILNPVTQALVISASPLAYSVGASSDTLKKIDVGGAVVPSKTGYSSDGSLNKNPSEAYFDAGSPTIASAHVYDLNHAWFGWLPGDKLNLTVTGTFTAFTQAGASVSLVQVGTCAAPFIQVAASAITATRVTFSNVALSSLLPAAGGYAGILCFRVPAGNAMPIDATTIDTSAAVTRASSGTTIDSSAVAAMSMVYNGPVAVVYTFNPGSNSNQQSFLRVSNTSTAGGLVTITGRDDAGNAAAGRVSFNLAAGASIQLNASDLENGNTAKGLNGALGMGAGKWILTVTGEIAGMEVTNLNRNNSTGTLNNLGTPIDGAH